MNGINFMPFGSCRITRPFLSRNNGSIYNNVFNELNVFFPRVGFFHSLPEISQLISFIKTGFHDVEPEIKSFLFRKEAELTTPGNEFDASIWDNDRFSSNLAVNIYNLDYILIEVSSLNYFRCKKTNLFLHWNPNKYHNYKYSDIYPEGFYEKIGMGSSVIHGICDIQLLIESIYIIRKNLPKTKIILTGHIHDPESYTRRNLNMMLNTAANEVEDVVFFDNQPTYLNFGYNFSHGYKDIHHLSTQGERQLGIELQNYMLRNV